MKKIAITILALSITVTVLFIIRCNEPEGPSGGPTAASLLPEENEVTGWVFDTDSLCYEGLVDDNQGLNAIIDGGDVEYIKRGFVAGAFKGYSDGNRPICLQIYDQGCRDSAISVYQAMRTGTYETLPSLGDSARIDTSLVYDYEINMVADKFFVRLTADKTEEYKQAAISIAQAIAGKTGK